MTGYTHHLYADSLREFGTPRELTRCGGWILERPIPGSSYLDGMGCYPLFACQEWTQLCTDIDALSEELVSLAMVTDPFGEYTVEQLKQCFDSAIPFKEHFIADLCHPVETIPSKHHRYYARKAFQNVLVEQCPAPTQWLDEWVALYATLVSKHNLTGIKAFSRAAFEKQLAVPGTVMFRATHQGTTVGAHVWYTDGTVGYSHLEATSPAGYQMMAAYALYSFALEWFSDKVRWLNLGAGSGTNDNTNDGLRRFKSGWSTGTRMAYFCSRIYDPQRYQEMVNAKGGQNTDYFPAYRRGELA